MTVCHIGTLPFEKMGQYTKDIFHFATGDPIYCQLGGKYPTADIYVLHCFKKHHREFRRFKRPYSGSKIISLIHSSAPCEPARESDMIITETWYQHWKYLYENISNRMIYPFVRSSELLADIQCQFFGHILRYDKGKYHHGWNRAVKHILDAVPESRMYIISRNPKPIKHTRAIYNQEVENEYKLDALCELSIAVFAHGSFEEVFPMAVLECMSVGLPIVYLYQPSMAEMIGPDQIACKTIKELEQKTIMLLNNHALRAELGQKARERSLFFTQEKSILEWNRLFQEVLK